MIISELKPNLTETDRGKEFYNNIVQNVLNNDNIKHYFRNSSFGALYAERFNRTIRVRPKRPVSEKGEIIWTDVLPITTKQYNIRVHTSTKLTPIQASFKRTKDLFTNIY